MYTQELVREESVVHIFGLLCWFLPCLGFFGGAISSLIKKRGSYLLWGMGLGLIGPLNLLLWSLYSGLLDKFGFDSVKAFFLNILVFVSIGILLGFFLAFLFKFRKKEV